MSRQQPLQVLASDPHQADRHVELPACRCYSAAQIIAFLGIGESAFYDLKRRHRLPFVQELTPRLGRLVRYKAEPVDRYLAGEWQSATKHFFSGKQRLHAAQRRTSADACVTKQSFGQGKSL